ncbi:hypothetical protein [Streptomyces sp. CB02959]|uniref:hypothetical protein n=1 Tax=Streptomyces sp. CB02959 TaxID=2020330 RepID=UPI00215232C5|nr:hypothetical protein [Streptomyces sp. CB02959]
MRAERAQRCVEACTLRAEQALQFRTRGGRAQGRERLGNLETGEWQEWQRSCDGPRPLQPVGQLTEGARIRRARAVGAYVQHTLQPISV